jgi:hypothetical protein
MKVVDITTFKGRVPRFDPALLPSQGAQVATNCNTDRGTLRAYKGTTFVLDPTKSGTIKTIYRFGGSFWFHWITDVNVVRGPIAGNTTERTYWTGEGVPKVTDSSIATSGGGTNYPNNSYTLGLPAPTVAPSVVVTGGSVDTTTAESRVYVYTYVSGWGEESAPSPASAIVSPEPVQGVTLSSMSGAPSGAYNVVKKNIYRTVTGVSGTEFHYVGYVNVAVSTFPDAVPSSTVGANEILATTEWDMPPADLAGLTIHPGGFMAGFSGKDLYISVAYAPHAWPDGFKITMEHPIIGIGVFGNSILVTTTGTAYVVSGSTPGELSKERLEINQSCVSKRGLVDLGAAIAYPSPDGLMVVGTGIMKNATEALMLREDWLALVPSSILGVYHDGKYYGFYDTGTKQAGFVYDPASEDWKDIDVFATAAWSDPLTDTLYLQVGNNIVSWDTGSALTYTWKSKQFDLPKPINPGLGQVFAKTYPCTLKLYADGTLKHTQTVLSNWPFTLPSGYLADMVEVEVTGTSEIKRISIVETIDDLR